MWSRTLLFKKRCVSLCDRFGRKTNSILLLFFRCLLCFLYFLRLKDVAARNCNERSPKSWFTCSKHTFRHICEESEWGGIPLQVSLQVNGNGFKIQIIQTRRSRSRRWGSSGCLVPSGSYQDFSSKFVTSPCIMYFLRYCTFMFTFFPNKMDMLFDCNNQITVISRYRVMVRKLPFMGNYATVLY